MRGPGGVDRGGGMCWSSAERAGETATVRVAVGSRRTAAPALGLGRWAGGPDGGRGGGWTEPGICWRQGPGSLGGPLHLRIRRSRREHHRASRAARSAGLGRPGLPRPLSLPMPLVAATLLHSPSVCAGEVPTVRRERPLPVLTHHPACDPVTRLLLRLRLPLLWGRPRPGLSSSASPLLGYPDAIWNSSHRDKPS